jgi:hypothetical protein
LSALTKDESFHTRMDALWNENTPEDDRTDEIKANASEWQILERLAREPRTKSEILSRLSEDESGEVRAAVGENPSTPQDILRKLAKSTDVWVRKRAALNRNMPPDELLRLWGDGDEATFSSLASNPATPPDVLDALSGHSDWMIRRHVQFNRSTSLETLQRILATCEPYSRRKIRGLIDRLERGAR